MATMTNPHLLNIPLLSAEEEDHFLHDGQPTDGNIITISQIQPLLKGSQFGEGVDKYIQEMSLFQAKHKLQRINNAISVIKEKWPEATPIQLYVGFDLADCCIDDYILNLDNQDFIQKVIQETSKKLTPNSISDPEASSPQQPSFSAGESESDESDDDYIAPKNTFLNIEDVSSQRKKKKTRTVLPHLDATEIPPAPTGVSENEWKTWSSVHRSSYLAGMEFPNTFLYRNPPPGVAHKNGPWTEDEHRAFLRRVQEIRGDADTIDGNWGTFSLAIPGRVGYQCSNYYRHLILEGILEDSCYFIDEEGKLHHKSHYHGPEPFGTASKPLVKRPKSTKTLEKEKFKDKKKENANLPVRTSPRQRKQLQKAESDDDDDNQEPSNDENPVPKTLYPSKILSIELFRGSSQKKKKEIAKNINSYSNSNDNEQNAQAPIVSRYDQWALMNPLPSKMIDLITNEPILVPTLAPDGYVLDYKTWVKVLIDKNESPFTRQKFNKRDLIVLTTENFEEFQSKIINI